MSFLSWERLRVNCRNWVKHLHKKIGMIASIFFIVCLLLTSINAVKAERPVSEVTYMKSETKKDPAIEKAFAKEFGLKKGSDSIRYFYNKIDLNDDQVPETFVYLVGPTVCGTGGCSGLLLEEKDGEYKVKTRFSLVRTPIMIQNETTNGWKDIVMYVTGGGIEPGYHQLKYNGKTYPSNPSVEPIIKEEKIKGIGILNDELTQDNGIVF